MDNLSLLQNFKKSDFYIDPYPHVIIHDALPQDTYEKLKDAAPSNLIPDKSLDNVRGNINFDQLENMPEHKIFLDFRRLIPMRSSMQQKRQGFMN